MFPSMENFSGPMKAEAGKPSYLILVQLTYTKRFRLEANFWPPIAGKIKF